MAIDREELNQIFWLGIGEPRTIVPADDNPYNPGPEYGTMWATHEPNKANALLDKLGLSKKDGDGFRLRTDGKGRLTLEVMVFAASGMPYTQIAELVRVALARHRDRPAGQRGRAQPWRISYRRPTNIR